MKAALLKNIGSLVIRDIKRPEYSPGEVLVKVEACSVCSTDVKIIFQGHRDLKLPRILGHEIVGTVFKTGKNVKGIKKGQRVQISPGVPCGKCRYCLKGLENMCDHMRIIGFHLNGGFAPYLLVPASGVKAGIINPIPKRLSFEESCLAEP
ncbi:alcohol dehydrogenase catalytic domain-containing protein, partial [bacterium]|nr:alcohol dehydrogenase catalytic domain-containing protein [bacterium]